MYHKTLLDFFTRSFFLDYNTVLYTYQNHNQTILVPNDNYNEPIRTFNLSYLAIDRKN